MDEDFLCSGDQLLETITKTINSICTLSKLIDIPKVEATRTRLREIYEKLIVDELFWNATKQALYFAFFDAKSAFNVVPQNSLLKRLFDLDVEGQSCHRSPPCMKVLSPK